MKKLVFILCLVRAIFAESVAEESAHSKYEAADLVLMQLNTKIEKYLESRKPDERQLTRFTDPLEIEEANYSFQKELDYYNRSVESVAKLQKGFLEFTALLEDALASGIDGSCANVIRMNTFTEAVKWYSEFLTAQLDLNKEEIE